MFSVYYFANVDSSEIELNFRMLHRVYLHCTGQIHLEISTNIPRERRTDNDLEKTGASLLILHNIKSIWKDLSQSGLGLTYERKGVGSLTLYLKAHTH